MTETQTINKTETQREENGGSRYLQTRVLSQRPLIRAYLGDCMDWMQATADKTYDLAIVDPPYGAGDIRNCTQLKYRTYINKKPEKFYFDELRRVSENQIIWGGNYFSKLLFDSRGWIFWNKMNPNPKYSDGELAWTSYDRILRVFNYMYTNIIEGKGNYSNNTKDKIIHPTQKPVALYRWLLKNYAKAGQRILDTHGGSFSSAVACYIEGFDLDICEIDADYFEASVKRFKQATQQIHLFDERLL